MHFIYILFTLGIHTVIALDSALISPGSPEAKGGLSTLSGASAFSSIPPRVVIVPATTEVSIDTGAGVGRLPAPPPLVAEAMAEPSFVTVSIAGAPTTERETTTAVVKNDSYVCRIFKTKNNRVIDSKKYFGGSLIKTPTGNKAILSSASLYETPEAQYVVMFEDNVKRPLRHVYYYQDPDKGSESISLGFLDSYPEGAMPLEIGTLEELRAAGEESMERMTSFRLPYPADKPDYFFPFTGAINAYHRPMATLSHYSSLPAFIESFYEDNIKELFNKNIFFEPYTSSSSTRLKGFISCFKILCCICHTPRTKFVNTLLPERSGFTPSQFFLTSSPIFPLEAPVQTMMEGSGLILKGSQHIIAITDAPPSADKFLINFYKKQFFALASIIVGCAIGGYYRHNPMAYGVIIPMGLWFLCLCGHWCQDPNIVSDAYFEGQREYYAPLFSLKKPIEDLINAHYGVAR